MIIPLLYVTVIFLQGKASILSMVEGMRKCDAMITTLAICDGHISRRQGFSIIQSMVEYMREREAIRPLVICDGHISTRQGFSNPC